MQEHLGFYMVYRNNFFLFLRRNDLTLEAIPLLRHRFFAAQIDSPECSTLPESLLQFLVLPITTLFQTRRRYEQSLPFSTSQFASGDMKCFLEMDFEICLTVGKVTNNLRTSEMCRVDFVVRIDAESVGERGRETGRT